MKVKMNDFSKTSVNFIVWLATVLLSITFLLSVTMHASSSYAHTEAPTLPASGQVQGDSAGHSGHAGHNMGGSDAQGGVTEHNMAGHSMASDGSMSMNHPGLSDAWVILAFLLIAGIVGWALGAPVPNKIQVKALNLNSLPVIGRFVDIINSTPIFLFMVKVVSVTAFVLVVIAGLFGSIFPERNLATVLVWNWWWPLVIVSVFFLGTAWCAICPWDTLASWIVRRKFWKRANPHPGLNRPVPKFMRNVWPALLLLTGLTFLELGIGVTSIPVATALMALVMLTLSIIFLVLYERKAFCRYACPVGRTLGFYSRLAPIAIRPKDEDTCLNCKTLECYRGSETVEPCPTHLTVGKFSQNTFCLSCGNCVLSCPKKNVSWKLRTMGSEAADDARPLWDGAWFMLGLLGITTFHGVTMLPNWTDLVVAIATTIGESGKLVFSFTIAMLGGFLVPVLIYAVAIRATLHLATDKADFKKLFVALPFCTLPLAFTYHLAHNLSHLIREGAGVLALFLNPLGTGLKAMTGMELHEQMMDTIVSEDVLFALQTGLIVMGVWLAVSILRHRGRGVLAGGASVTGAKLVPMLVFIVGMAGANIWLLSQDMEMRFSGSDAAAEIPEWAARRINPIPNSTASSQYGERIFLKRCAACHGESLKGDGWVGAVLDEKPLDLNEHTGHHTDGQIAWKISNGKPEKGMPAWKLVISEDDIWNIINYLRTATNTTSPAYEASGHEHLQHGKKDPQAGNEHAGHEQHMQHAQPKHDTLTE